MGGLNEGIKGHDLVSADGVTEYILKLLKKSKDFKSYISVDNIDNGGYSIKFLTRDCSQLLVQGNSNSEVEYGLIRDSHKNDIVGFYIGGFLGTLSEKSEIVQYLKSKLNNKNELYLDEYLANKIVGHLRELLGKDSGTVMINLGEFSDKILKILQKELFP